MKTAALCPSTLMNLLLWSSPTYYRLSQISNCVNPTGHILLLTSVGHTCAYPNPQPVAVSDILADAAKPGPLCVT